MANYVVWNAIKVKEFKYLARLTPELEKVFDDMINPKISIIQTANALNIIRVDQGIKWAGIGGIL